MRSRYKMHRHRHRKRQHAVAHRVGARRVSLGPASASHVGAMLDRVARAGNLGLAASWLLASRSRRDATANDCGPRVRSASMSRVQRYAGRSQAAPQLQIQSHASPTLSRRPAMLIFDAHLDLSMNALEWNRDLTRDIDEIRAREQGQTDKPDRGNGTVSLGEMRKGGVGLCVATLIARYVKPGNPLPGFHSPEIAWAQTQGQLAWYRAMEEAGQMTPIRDLAGARTSTCKLWKDPPARRADRLHPEPRRGRLDPARPAIWPAPTSRACGPSARPTTARAPTRKARTSPAASAPRGRELLGRNGAAGHHPRRHAPVRRQLLGSPRPLSRTGVGQPQQLPRAGQRHAAVQRRADQGAHRPRRGDRRRARRLDDGARLDSRQDHARARPA